MNVYSKPRYCDQQLAKSIMFLPPCFVAQIINRAGDDPHQRVKYQDEFVQESGQPAIMFAEKLYSRPVQTDQRFDLDRATAAAPDVDAFDFRREQNFPARRLETVAPID